MRALREITKLQAEIEKKGLQSAELTAELRTLTDRLRGLRLVAIRAGEKPGELPYVPGFETWRDDQQRKELIAHSNHEIDLETWRDPVIRGNVA